MKLSTPQYEEYWRNRMAIGPDEASFNGKDADQQGLEIWSLIEGNIQNIAPRSVLEFGCGYGRMLRKLRCLWPKAKLYGVDLCQEALARVDCGAKLSQRIPKGLRVDLVFSCLALQHVTDESVFQETVAAFGAALTNRGAIVLFENISKPGADHVRDMSAQDYMSLWPELDSSDYGWLKLGGQDHALMIGKKR